MRHSKEPEGWAAGADGVWWTSDATATNWEPLEAFVGDSAVMPAAIEPADFMWMSEVLLSTGVVIQMYKHIMTRRYMYLGDDGRAYWASGGCYVQHDRLGDAVEGLELER
ncbi:MAG: hypothetical protein ACE37B_11335 [Ilumatobacter sp.]|uniref:hypothetical protein n=1 Tax=Ilumatobacter sp. TaxID=1967498 RepID=UPI003918EEB3